jgi:hypothetical protein
MTLPGLQSESRPPHLAKSVTYKTAVVRKTNYDRLCTRAPPALPQADLSAPTLAGAIVAAVSDPALRERAAVLGALIKDRGSDRGHHLCEVLTSGGIAGDDESPLTIQQARLSLSQ